MFTSSPNFSNTHAQGQAPVRDSQLYQLPVLRGSLPAIDRSYALAGGPIRTSLHSHPASVAELQFPVAFPSNSPIEFARYPVLLSRSLARGWDLEFRADLPAPAGLGQLPLYLHRERSDK